MPRLRLRRRPTIITRADRAREAGEWQLAAKLYRIALERTPNNPPIWIQYGHALKESGSPAEAENAYRTAIAYEPADADAHLQLGHALKLQGKRGEAEAAYRRAWALDRSLTYAARELMAFGWTRQRLAEAADHAFASSGPDESRAAAPVNGPSRRSGTRRRKEGLITRADRAQSAGQWSLAARLYRKALDRNPDNPPIWVQYGHALKEAGDSAEAERAYRTALSYAPGVADTHLQLGHALKLQGKTEEAQAAYLRAFARDPSLPYPLQELSGLGWSEAEVTELQVLSAPYAVGSLAGAPANDTEPAVTPNPLRIPEEVRRIIAEAWSGFFDPDWYLENNPDVVNSGMDPLDHFLLCGLKEGRKPRTPKAKIVPAIDAEIQCLLKPSLKDEVALFVTHSPHGQLRTHVRHYLERLNHQGIAVVLIVATDASFNTSVADLKDIVDGIFIRRNEGYDFAAWAHVLLLCPEFFDARVLYLINDSVIGPTNDAAFADILERVRKSPAGLIGLTENFNPARHIQTYFIALKASALSSAALHRNPLRAAIFRDGSAGSDNLFLEVPLAVRISVPQGKNSS